MSKQTGVFICPSCQNVIQSDGPIDKGITCDECHYEFGTPDDVSSAKSAQSTVVPQGNRKKKKASVSRDVTAKRAPIAQKGLEVEKIPLPIKTLDEVIEESVNDGQDEEMIMPDGSRRVRRRKKRPKKEKNRNLILFLIGWIGVITIIFVLFKQGDAGGKEEEPESREAFNEKTVKDEILRRFYSEVTQNFRAFLNHPTNDGREQFISSSADLALPFSKHYQLNSFPTPDSSLAVIQSNVIRLSEKDFGIETVWQDGTGGRLGAVHLWDGEAWKLDWENFAPYSTQSWSRFRSEIGPREGTFRLLVRKRETGDETEKFYLSFYRPPLFHEKSEEFRLTESPEVELATQSELGQEFLKLWEEHKSGEVPFDSILGEALDPSNYLRLNVSLAWEENDREETVMVLKDIMGVLWFGEVIQSYYREGIRNELKEKEEPELEEEISNTDIE